MGETPHGVDQPMSGQLKSPVANTILAEEKSSSGMKEGIQKLRYQKMGEHITTHTQEQVYLGLIWLWNLKGRRRGW